MHESTKTVVVAILVNLAIAAAKYFASAMTGSAAMAAEAIHSTVDAGNSALLLLGIRRSAKPADDRHPFGYGREIYFWSLVVAVVIFGAGGIAAISEGLSRFSEPHALENIGWSYAVLGIALVFEGISWTVAYRAIAAENPGMTPFTAAQRSKDPSLFVVLFEDTAAIAGLIIALAGTFGAMLFPSKHLDAIASLLIGALLIVTALFLMDRTRSLLVGEGADDEIVNGIRTLLMADPRVASVHRILTAQMAPGYVLLNMDLRFHRAALNADLPQTIQEVERKIRDRFPVIQEVFIEVQALTESSEQGTRGE
jgi:cation diffusion facilitator family transporter